MSAIDAVIVEMIELMRENESLKKRLECLEKIAQGLLDAYETSSHRHLPFVLAPHFAAHLPPPAPKPAATPQEESQASEPEDETPAGLKSRGWLTTSSKPDDLIEPLPEWKPEATTTEMHEARLQKQREALRSEPLPASAPRCKTCDGNGLVSDGLPAPSPEPCPECAPEPLPASEQQAPEPK